MEDTRWRKTPANEGQSRRSPSNSRMHPVAMQFVVALSASSDSRRSVWAAARVGIAITMLNAIVELITRDIVLMAKTPDADRTHHRIDERGGEAVL